MSKIEQRIMKLQDKELEIEYAILEAKNMNMGNIVPITTIIRQAAKLARCDIKDVIVCKIIGDKNGEKITDTSN